LRVGLIRQWPHDVQTFSNTTNDNSGIGL
jgi:hypothetical protein